MGSGEIGAGAALLEFFEGFLDDEGSVYALDVMQHYVTGRGRPFVRGERGGVDVLGWRGFMINRPEIQEAMRYQFPRIAARIAARSGPDEGTFREVIRQTVDLDGDGAPDHIRLNELQSMRLTLHGAHRIVMTGRYRKLAPGLTMRPECAPGRPLMHHPTCHVRAGIVLLDVWFIWEDRGDLHGRLATVLESGRRVSDQAFTDLGMGQDYDIAIHFDMPGASVWRANADGTRYEYERGWPPPFRVPTAGGGGGSGRR